LHFLHDIHALEAHVQLDAGVKGLVLAPTAFHLARLDKRPTHLMI
jgi:hypothetical protein